MLSDYCKKNCWQIWNKFWWCKKLIPNLGNKTKYVLYYKNFRLYLFLEMKLTKVQKVLKFKQSDWIKKINLNNEKRTNTANSFWKRFFKIFSNIVNWGYPDNFKPAYFFIFIFLFFHFIILLIYFFDEKISRAQNHATSENQPTKQNKPTLNFYLFIYLFHHVKEI